MIGVFNFLKLEKRTNKHMEGKFCYFNIQCKFYDNYTCGNNNIIVLINLLLNTFSQAKNIFLKKPTK